MKLIKPSYEILDCPDNNKLIELAGRTCYKSEDKITEESADKFIEMILNKGHESVVEHEKITVKFICDRGVSHELVRHRIASFSQESTRYCNYSKTKFDNEITFIIPNWCSSIEEMDKTDWDLIHKSSQGPERMWVNSMIEAEKSYMYLIGMWTPQQARSVLPNSLKTEIVVTANLREWREIFRQRTSKAAHPQMRELMCPLLNELKEKLPVIFKDIDHEDN
jgi:thymidylate synthase (FAD)